MSLKKPKKLEKIVVKFWRDMDAGKLDDLMGYFSKNAAVTWPNTGESFDAEGFLRANSERRSGRRIEVEKMIMTGNMVVSVVKVANETISFYAASFFRFKSKKIVSLDEYWVESAKNPARKIEDKTVPDFSNVDDEDGDDDDAFALPDGVDVKIPRVPKIPRGATAPLRKTAWTRMFFPEDAI
ncbi:MAG: nuclear transport factor 2 family protein [Synergistaceae bacterium]|jgi:hypothetical protein|nr:nuclear transport factor 2 family protein [Synergistaceae bacterium]